MATQYRTFSTTPAHATTTDDQRRFVRFLYQDGRGYVEIVAGETDPDQPGKIKLLMHTRRWLLVDPERPDLDDALLNYAASLKQQYGNVYISVRLYTRQAKEENKRDEAYVLPSRVLFVDDAPADPLLPYTAFVQTSTDSGHGYYLADKCVSKPLGKRAAAALGGDPSGYDLTQLVRLPDTTNTKNHGAFRVNLRRLSGRAYSTTDLCAAFPDVVTRRNDGTPATPVAWPAAEKALGNVKRLIGRIRATMKPACQTRRILGENLDGNGEQLSYIVKGKHDASRSMNRCVVAHGLLLAGFPDHEIAAVLYTCCDWGHSGEKGSTWLQGDIERCITDAHEAYPDASKRQNATRGAATQDATPILHKSRARKDRPQRFSDADRVLQELVNLQDARGKICQSRPALAKTMGISIPTLDRLLKPLREQGLVQWQFYNQRQDSYLELSENVLSSFQPAPRRTASQRDSASFDNVLSRSDEYSDTTPDHSVSTNGGYTPPPETCPGVEVAPFAAVSAANNAETVLVEPPSTTADAHGAGCVSPLASEPITTTLLSLRDLVKDAFDAAPGRIMLNWVKKYISLQDGTECYGDAAIKRTIAAERKYRASKDSIFAKAREEARAASMDELRRKSKSAASGYASAQKRLTKLQEREKSLSVDEEVAYANLRKSIGFRRVLAQIWSDEETRRDDIIERDQLYLIALADQALAELRSQPTPAPAPEPIPTPEPVKESIPIPTWRELVERLKARSASLASAA